MLLVIFLNLWIDLLRLCVSLGMCWLLKSRSVIMKIISIFLLLMLKRVRMCEGEDMSGCGDGELVVKVEMVGC